jgi:SAM-dependent MidA family methyltransferase
MVLIRRLDHNQGETSIFRLTPQVKEVSGTRTHQTVSLPVPSANARKRSEQLVAHIGKALDHNAGWLAFDRYMALALYAPELGYYSGQDTQFGRHSEDGSDFVTASEVSPFFAQTLARAIIEMLRASGTRTVIELGAGNGVLAAQLLLAFDALAWRCDHYAIIEVSEVLRRRQRATLAACSARLAPHVQWLDAVPEAFCGVVFGNEVLDAMPVRLFVRKAGRWFERGVVRSGVAAGATDRALAWDDQPVQGNGRDSSENSALLASIGGHHDYLTETHEAAAAMVRTICTRLQRGALLLIDYGFPHSEYYHPQRNEGTLMCHYRHHAHIDPFFYPGLQDLTAHVAFSRITQAALEVGVDLLGYTSQARFLLNCGITDLLGKIDPGNPEYFLPAANAVQKLLSEAEMGELFKVIAFGRGIDTELSAFAHGDRSHCL